MSAVSNEDMHVLKRNGEREIVAFDKILARLKTLGQAAGITGVNYTTLVIKIIDQLYDPTMRDDGGATPRLRDASIVYYRFECTQEYSWRVLSGNASIVRIP
jgi:hypothetical protein